MSSDETMKVITIYEQNEYIFLDKVRRITPIKIRPIDKSNYKRKRIVFTGGDTNFRVIPNKKTILEPYEWSAKEIKPKIEFKPKFEKDIKPWIKCESKDVKPLIKSEIKEEFKHKIKDENKEEIIKEKEKSKELSSDELPDSEALKRKTSSEELVGNKKACLDIETGQIILNEDTSDNDFDGFEPMDDTSLDSDAIPQTPQAFEDMDDTSLDSDAIPQTPHGFEDMDETTIDSDELPHALQCFEDISETTLDSDEIPVDAQESNQTEQNVAQHSVINTPVDQQSGEHNYCTAISTPSGIPVATNNDLNNSLESSTSSLNTIIYEYIPPVVKDSCDRFGPELRTKVYNLILSSFTLEDKLKFKLELVCKEWQQIIVSQQKTIRFHYKQRQGVHSSDISFCGNAITFANSNDFNEISTKLISKFSELTDIQVLGRSNTNINLIVNKINDLVGITSVKLRGKMSTDVLTRFGLCFGTQLKSVDINSGSYCLTDEELIESKLLSDNLESIHVFHCMERLNLTKLPQLRQLLDVSLKDIDGLGVVADEYANQVTKISFSDPEDSKKYLHTKSRIAATLQQLSRFERLEYLDFYYANNFLNVDFQPIEQNCKHLKELHIFGSNSHFSLQRLTAFKDLRVLGLFIDGIHGTRLEFSALNSLDLVELWMYCDIYSEELQNILISMKNLKTLHIISNFCYEPQIIELITCDSNLRTIYMEDILITKQTASAIVDKAKSNPKVHYSLISEVYSDKNRYHECKQLIRDDLPKNLTIITHRDTPEPFPKKLKRRPKSKRWQPMSALPPPKQLADIQKVSFKIRGPDPNCEWLRDHNYSSSICWRLFSSERKTWLSNCSPI